MRRGTLILLLRGTVAAVLTGLWCEVFSPLPETQLSFQVDLSLPAQASTQIYYDRGAGLRESESSARTVAPTDAFVTVRLPLPPGKYRELRFDPIDGAGTARFRNARIVTYDGRTLRWLPSSDFTPNDQVAEYREHDGVAYLESTPTANDPQLSITFDPVLRLAFGFWPKTLLYGRRWVLVFGISVAVVVVLASISKRLRGWPPAWRRFRERSPRAALAACALTGAIASSYPIVFFGKSLVSPTQGTLLLYDGNPTVPEFTDLRRDNVKGADVGAFMWHHFPNTVRQHRSLKEGALPLWNRYSATGVTLIGQGQSMFGDPFHLLVIAAGGTPLAWDAKYLLLKALFACGLGWCVWYLARDFMAAAILTLVSTFIGYFTYRYNHTAIFSLCYSPWILVGWLMIVSAPDRRALGRALIVWFIANWIVLTSGTVKEAYLLCIVLNLGGVLLFLFTAGSWREKTMRGLYIGAAAIAFLLVSSPLWWTFLHSLASAFTSYDTPRVYQIRREWFVGMFDDLFYRVFIPYNSVYQPSTNFVFLLGGLCAVFRLRRMLTEAGPLAIFLTAAGALYLAFQWGPPEYTPTWVLQVPLLRNVHYLNNSFGCIAIVPLGVLAGWGFSAIRAPLAAGKAGWITAFVVVVLTLMFIPLFLHTPPGWCPVLVPWADASTYQRIVYAHVVLLPASILVLLWAAAHRLRRQVGMGTLCLVVLALGIVLFRHGFHMPFSEPGVYFNTPGTRGNLLAPSPSVEYLQASVRNEPCRVIGTGTNFFPGFATAYNLEGINGPDALINRKYRELSESADLPLREGDWRYELRPADLPRWRPVLDFLNVRYVAAPPEVLSATEGYELVAKKDFDIFRSRHTWPRAFFTDRFVLYQTPADLVRLIRERSPGPPFAAIQAGDDLPSMPADHAATSDGDIIAGTDYVMEPNCTSFSITAPQRGIVVLQEAWLPKDFIVELNGKPVPYFRVNHAYKAVLVPEKGEYRIAFCYWPNGFTLTLVLALLGLAIFAMLCWLLVRKNQTAEQPAVAS